MADKVREVVMDMFGSKGDELILDYICNILEDEHFEFGDDGEEAFDHIGPFLVRYFPAPLLTRIILGQCMRKGG